MPECFATENRACNDDQNYRNQPYLNVSESNFGMAGNLKSHYDEMFEKNDGELYAPLAGLDLAAHQRRMELLENIPLPDLSDKVVVDYGVGSWGFGCIYPALKSCRHAIGFDISDHALAKSATATQNDPLLAGKKIDYFVSLGYEIGLPDNFVDVFFCGECIEHIEDTKAFLTEVYRVMKPGGIAIFTTPNAAPWLYRQFDIQWCVGFEHVALMNFTEFRESLERLFTPIEYIGFNQTILPDLDAHLPPQLHKKWAEACRNAPEDATSLIGIVRKDDDRKLPGHAIEIVDWRNILADGEVTPLALLGEADGGMIRAGNRFFLEVPEGMTRVNLIFWSHDWSGYAQVRCGEIQVEVNLYSHAGGCRRLTLDGLTSRTLIIEPTGTHDPRSFDHQIILYRACFAKEAANTETLAHD